MVAFAYKKRPAYVQCIRPLKASIHKSGKGLAYRTRDAIPGLVPFAIECRKCLPCRLNQAREKAVRAYHEAQMHPDNMFLTLTYNEQSLTHPKLIYKDWQDFMKRLRYHVSEETHNQTKLTAMVTGEYGDKNKRPHWHALIFNYRFRDEVHTRTTERGDRVYNSGDLQELWPYGRCEYGDLTIDSANYTARYAAKKLVHGDDADHDYHPIHRTSSKRAIGRSWIEKYHEHTFQNGFVVINEKPTKIPRYYVDWAKKHQPDLWYHYVTQIRPEIQAKAELQQRKEEMEYISQIATRRSVNDPRPLTRPKVKLTILESKFQQLQERLKL